MAQHALPRFESRTLPPRAVPETVWSRASWLVLAVVVLMLAFSTAQKAYRLTLPTDGWQPVVGAPNLTFDRHVLGGPTPIQPGDELLAVDGQEVTGWEGRGLNGQLVRPANWQVGKTVRYTVRRDGQIIDLSVPLQHWTGAALARSAFDQFVINGSGLVLLIGLFVFLKRPGSHAARLLLLISAVALVSSISWLGSPGGLEEPFTSPALMWIAAFCSHLTHPPLASLQLYFVLTFPHPNPLVCRFPRGTLAAIIGVTLLLFAIFFITGQGLQFFGWVILTSVLEIGFLIHALRQPYEPVARAQLRWFALGILISNAAGVLIIFGWLGLVPAIEPLNSLPFDIFIPITLAIAILRHHLFDIDIIINRTLVYGTLTAFVIGTYVLVVAYIGAVFRAENTLGPSLVATGLVAVAFQPMRAWVQRVVNHLLYGERDEPYAALSRFGQRLEATLAPDAVLPAIVEIVAQTLRLPYVAITLGQRAADVPDTLPGVEAVYGTPPATDMQGLVTLPLTYQGEPVGQLTLTPRPGEHTLSRADQRLLHDLARQAGVALHAVRLTADLQRLNADLQHARVGLVTAREEERRRLRRDLHDGLGPTLASLTLKLDAARNLLYRAPERTEALLQTTSTQLQDALGDIRRLVYNLRPPALDELGLVEAVRQHIRQLEHILVTIDAPELPPLPAAVEVAAYRIVLEALTNVVRHASAQTCTVRLALDGSALCVEVCDDGIGLSATHHVGIGLHAMRERAEELGGTCTITSGDTGGACVRAWLPLGDDAARRQP